MIFTTTYEKEDTSLMAQLREANKYLPWINEAAEKYSIQPSIIAGLGSRESQWGLDLNPEGPSGTGDFTERRPKPPERPDKLPSDGLGFGRGLLQIDFDWHEFARSGKWMDPRENILYGCSILRQTRANFLGFGDILREYGLLRAMLASFNAGTGNALRGMALCLDVDTNTRGHNYSADVLNRAGWFQLQGWT